MCWYSGRARGEMVATDTSPGGGGNSSRELTEPCVEKIEAQYEIWLLYQVSDSVQTVASSVTGQSPGEGRVRMLNLRGSGILIIW